MEKLFEAKIPPKTIEKRAQRQLKTNVSNAATTPNNSQNKGNQTIKRRGGKRKGAGRKKNEVVITDAQSHGMLLQYAWDELITWQDRYSSLMEFADIFTAIEKLHPQFNP